MSDCFGCCCPRRRGHRYELVQVDELAAPEEGGGPSQREPDLLGLQQLGESPFAALQRLRRLDFDVRRLAAPLAVRVS